MIREATEKLIKHLDLSMEEASACIDEIMSGQTSEVQTAAFLTALASKGETVEEISGCAAAMRAHALPFDTEGEAVFEIVGTGGDRAGTFNISTTSAFVLASGGVKIAKHGNRAASSKSGAADVLEALGARIDLSPEQGALVLKKANMCFLFAQKYHTAMKYVAPVRKQMGVPTVFNILGPLTNPARAARQLMGVYAKSLVEPMAKVLSNLGVERGMVVFGEDGLDEISASASTAVCEFQNGEFRSYTISPEDFGLSRCEKAELLGGTPEENAAITRAILQGEKSGKRTAVLLNAGAGLYLADKAESMKKGVQTAAELIDSGKACQALENFVKATNEAAQ